jgi:rfaE bifunctional protein nucleotidyltransferase chain/domain
MPKRKRPLVFISGVFDCFHDGHRDLLRQASEYGDVFVAVNSDAYVKKHKGKGRPHDKASIRMVNVIDSGFVSYVCINEEDSPLNLILGLKPEFLAVGNDYSADRIVGLQEGAAWGCKAIIVPRVRPISTTQILKEKKT